MNRIAVAAIMAACVFVCAGSALAQDESYIFGEYYVCDMNREAFADTLVEHVLGPIYQRHVDSGELTAWGWLAHHAGGRWRRLLYTTGNNLDTMLAARDKIIEEQQAEVADEGREFVSICGSHDDLVWSHAAGPPATEMLANAGPVSYSTYYVCDVTKQERADEIVQQLFTPAINSLMGGSGPLSGWGWYAHVIGGRYRRLMTHSGMSHASLFDAGNQDNELAAALRECDIQLGLNDQSLRNHLTHTAQVIAGLGTLHTLQRSAEEDRELMEAIVGSPLPCPKP